MGEVQQKSRAIPRWAIITTIAIAALLTTAAAWQLSSEASEAAARAGNALVDTLKAIHTP